MHFDGGTILSALDLDTSGFTNGMQMAASQLDGFNTGGFSERIGALGSAMETAGRTMSLAVSAPLLGLATASVKTGMDFDASMSNVAALSGATGVAFDNLRDKAREMGATTIYSATQAADAFGYMALAGWDSEQMIAGIPGVLNLAAAAGMDLARASDIVTDTMTPFGMAAEEAGRAADVFALAQAKSNTNVEQLGDAMKYAAPNAAAFGMTLEDTAGALGILANAGIKGSMAGTTLNAILRDMKKSAEDGAIAIGNQKVSIVNADGSYRSYAEIIKDVDAATQGMSQSQRDAALSAIFGDESIKGINATLAQGTGALDEFTGALYEADGTAEHMASVLTDNLKGDITAMGSAISESAIGLSDFLTPAIRGAVQWVTNAVSGFNSLSEGTRTLIYRIGGVAAAIGPVLLVGGKLLGVLGSIGTPIGIVAAGFAALYKWCAPVTNVVDKMGMSLDIFWRNIKGGNDPLMAFARGINRGFGAGSYTMLRDWGRNAQKTLSNFKQHVGSAVTALGAALTQEASAIRADWAEGGVMGVLGGVAERMGERVHDAIPLLQTAAGTMRDTLLSGVSAGIAYIAPKARTLMGNIGTALFSAKDYAITKLPAVREAIMGALVATRDTVTQKAGDVMTWLGEAYRSESVQGFLGDLGGVAAGVMDKISVTKDSLIKKAGDLLSTLGTALGSEEAKAKVTQITGVAATIAGKIVSNMGDFKMTATTMVTNLIAQLGDNGFLTTLIGDSNSGLGGVVTAIAGGIGAMAENIASCASDILSTLFDTLTQNDGKLVTDLFTNAGDIVTAIGSQIIGSAANIGVAATELATNLLTSLGDMDWSAAGNTIGVTLSSVATGLLDAIMDNAPAMIDSAGPLVEAIGNGIANAGTALGAAAGALVGGLIKYLTDGDTWEKVKELGGALLKGIREGADNLGEGILTGIANGTNEFVDGIRVSLGGEARTEYDRFLTATHTFVGDFGQEFSRTGSQIAGTLNNFPGIFMGQTESIKTAAGAYALAVGAGFEEEFPNASFLANDAIVGLLLVVSNSMESEVDRAKAYATLQMAGYTKEATQALFSSQGSVDVKLKAKTFMDSANDEIVAGAATLGTLIPGALSSGYETGIPILEVAAKRLGSVASGAWEKDTTISDAEAVAGDVTNKTAAKLDEGAPDVQTSATGIATGVGTALEPLPGLMEETSRSGVSGMEAAISEGEPEVVTAMDTLSDATVKAALAQMSVATGRDIGTGFVNAIALGIVSLTPTLTSAGNNIALFGVNATSAVMSSAAGHAIGGNMIDGVIGGVRSRGSALNNAIVAVARSAVNAMRRALDINSPSGVFAREVGAWIPGGVGMGVTKNAASAITPLESLRDNMVGVFDKVSFGSLDHVRAALVTPLPAGDDAPWPSNGGNHSTPRGGDAPPVRMEFHIHGDWIVRDEADKEDILTALYERVMRGINEARRRI